MINGFMFLLVSFMANGPILSPFTSNGFILTKRYKAGQITAVFHTIRSIYSRDQSTPQIVVVCTGVRGHLCTRSTDEECCFFLMHPRDLFDFTLPF